MPTHASPISTITHALTYSRRRLSPAGNTFANVHAELYESRNWYELSRVNFYILVTFLVLCLDYIAKLYGFRSASRARNSIRSNADSSTSLDMERCTAPGTEVAALWRNRD